MRKVVAVNEETLQKAKKLEVDIAKKGKELVRTERGLERLQEVLEKDFTPDKIKKYILDLCEAEDVRLDREGGFFNTPNWDARKNGLDRVLALLRYTKNNETITRDSAPAKIVFNIVTAVPKEEPKNVVEVKEEP